MQISYAPKAKVDLQEAVKHYHGISHSLGHIFLNAVTQADELIRHWPNIGRLIAGGIRKQRIRKFPYALLYRVHGDHLHILRVVHLHTNPRNWD